jgi:hypothetical protein
MAARNAHRKLPVRSLVGLSSLLCCFSILLAVAAKHRGGYVIIRQDGIAFSAPEQLVDITGYFFQDDQGNEMVMVDRGGLPRGVNTVEALMADRRHEFEFKSQRKMKPLDMRKGSILGLKAMRLRFADDSDPDFVGCWVVALLDAHNYIQISYGGHGKASVGRSEHILASVRKAGNWPPAASGYARRHAGVITIEVPDSLRPPRTFSFVAPGEKTEIDVTLPQTGASPTSLEAAVAADAAIGVIRNQQKTSTQAGGPRSMVSYELTRREPNSEPQAVRHFQLFLGGRVVQVSGRSPVADAAQLDALLTQLGDSIQLEK